MSRSHTRQHHIAKKRATKRAKSKGWAPTKKQTQDALQGTLYNAQRRERRIG